MNDGAMVHVDKVCPGKRVDNDFNGAVAHSKHNEDEDVYQGRKYTDTHHVCTAAHRSGNEGDDGVRTAKKWIEQSVGIDV